MDTLGDSATDAVAIKPQWGILKGGRDAQVWGLTRMATILNCLKLAINRAFIILLTIAIAGCKFKSDIPPLVIPTAPPPAFQSSADTEGEVTPLEPEAVGGGLRVLGGFDSAYAMAQCGESLTWGDVDVGLCDVPGKDTFYIWTSSDQVYEVSAGHPYLAHFLQAADERVSAAESYEKEKREIPREIAGLVVELALAIPACATLILCLADGAAGVVTGLALAESGQALIDHNDTYLRSTANAGFYFCLIQGTDEARCREAHLGGGTP